MRWGMCSFRLNYIQVIAVFIVVSCPSLTTGSCIVQKKNYSVVLEAKIYQTRALVYGFLSPEGNELNISNPFSQTNMFGFYMYQAEPDAYHQMLLRLINMTKERLPNMQPAQTPLTFIATGAGNGNNVTQFLNNITNCLNGTGFELGNGSVSALHGRRKLYSWMSVNLLLGRFENATSSTTTVLDLGAGSSHDEFEITPNNTLLRRQKRQMTNVTICGKHYNVSGTSAHGLGLHEARVGMLMQDNSSTTRTNITNSKKFIIIDVESPCFYPNITYIWIYKEITYYITGAPSNTTGVNMTACRLQADNLIRNHTNQTHSLFGREIYAMSYYYQVLNESKIVSTGQNKNITVENIEGLAKAICQKPEPITRSHTKAHTTVPGDGSFACMDLIYTHKLLTMFYKLKNESLIDVVYSLNGVNVEWTLGIAYERYKSQMGLLAHGE